MNCRYSETSIALELIGVTGFKGYINLIAQKPPYTSIVTHARDIIRVIGMKVSVPRFGLNSKSQPHSWQVALIPIVTEFWRKSAV
jgi:hypothetical protein